MRRNPALVDNEEGTNTFNRIDKDSLWIHSFDTSPSSPLYPFYIDTVLKIKCGNCSVLSEVGIYYARSRYSDFQTQMGYIGGGDHYFIVIHPELRSSPWTEDTVIADPWSGLCYPVREAPKKLYDYLETVESIWGMSSPFVVPFNPSTQTLLIDDQF